MSFHLKLVRLKLTLPSCQLQPDVKTGKVDLGIDSSNGKNIGSGVTEDSSIALCHEMGFMFSCIMRFMILDLFKASMLWNDLLI